MANSHKSVLSYWSCFFKSGNVCVFLLYPNLLYLNLPSFFLQNRGSKQSLVSSSPVPVFVDQLDHGSLVSLDALEVMSECDAPVAFTRGSRSRASLPVVRSTNQTKDRSLGIIYTHSNFSYFFLFIQSETC